MEIIEEKFDVSAFLDPICFVTYIYIYIKERFKIVNNCSCKN